MTNRYYDLENIVDKVIEILQANLPAEIAIINSEKGDLPLTNPEAYTFGSRAIDPKIMKGKSTVEVVADSEIGTKFNEGETDDEGYLSINLILWESKPEVIERKALRYAIALRRAIDKNPLTRIVQPRPDNIGDSVVSEVRYGLLELIAETYSKTIFIRQRLKTIFTYE